MPSKNHGKKMRPTGAFSTPPWLLLVELLHSTCAKTMRRTQNLELSAAYYSRFPPRCGRESAIFFAVVDCGTERTRFGSVTFAMGGWGWLINGNERNILLPL